MVKNTFSVNVFQVTVNLMKNRVLMGLMMDFYFLRDKKRRNMSKQQYSLTKNKRDSTVKQHHDKNGQKAVQKGMTP